MPKYVPKAELKQQLAEPVEFELAGKTFKFEKIPTSVLQAMQGTKEDDPNAMVKVIEAFIGKEELLKLGALDAREVLPLTKWLGEIISVGLSEQEKNELKQLAESQKRSQGSSGTAT